MSRSQFVRWVALTACAAFVATVSRAEEDPPEPQAAAAKEVKLQTEDGLVLAAELYEPPGGGEGKPAVVAIHAEGGDRSMWRDAAPVFTKHGASVLAIDMRGHGGSKIQHGTTTSDGDTGSDLSPKIAARDLETFGAMWKDAAAGVKYLRATLLADGTKIAIAGAGACGAAGLDAASRDVKVGAALWIAPATNNFGAGAMEAMRKWDGRPIGIVTTAKSGRTDFDNVARTLAKQPRFESIVLAGPAAAAGEVLAKGEASADESVQFVLGWMLRPKYDGKEEIDDHSGAGKIVVKQTSRSFGGGEFGCLSSSGTEAPPEMDGLCVVACADAGTSQKLPAGARRLSFKPGPKGKEASIYVEIEEWKGGWKQVETRTLYGHGAIVLGKEFNTYQVLLTPRLLGVRPFSSVSVACVPIVKGKPNWSGKSKGPFGIDMTGEAVDPENPSTWDKHSLR